MPALYSCGLVCLLTWRFEGLPDSLKPGCLSKGGLEMRSVVVAAATMIGTALPATAEEFGRIEATLNGEDRIWYTLTMTQGGQTDASATFSTSRFTSDLHLQGHPRPSFTTSDVLSIDLMYRGEYQPGAAPMEAEVIYLPTGMRPPFWTSSRTGTPVTVTFEELTLEGETGRAVGAFAATLCMTEVLTDDPDPSQCQPIEGRFDTQVMIEE